MAVGADVLYRSGAGEAGDFAQSFDAGEAFIGSIFDDVVPIFAAHDFDFDGAVWQDFIGDTLHAVDDDGAGKTFVVTNGISTVAQDKSGHAELSGKAIGIGNVGRGFDL